jgi:hypothetical protein
MRIKKKLLKINKMKNPTLSNLIINRNFLNR